MPEIPKQLLIIGYTWPEPSTTAAGRRMMQLIRFFQEQLYAITFASTATKTKYSTDLEALGIKVQKIILNDSGFDTYVKELAPNIVLFDRFFTEEQFGWRVTEFAPNALRILDTEDLHSLRQVRERHFKKNIRFTVEKWLRNDMTKREMAAIYRSDLSLIISTYEMKLLQQAVNIDKKLLLHLPFQLDPITDSKMANWPGFNARKDFVCIGNGKHAPNIDAMVWLKQEIWPLIREALPDAKIHVYGSYFPQQLQEMHHPSSGFYIEGWIESVEEVMKKHRINLAPLRFGAGIKGKLIDAMGYGTPSITTSIGAEGMHGDLPWSGWVTDDAESFANAAVALYNHASDWRQSQENGVVIINTFYKRKVLDKRLLDNIESLENNLVKLREANFLGALLRHQTLNSTKYLSKWIEEKNKE